MWKSDNTQWYITTFSQIMLSQYKGWSPSRKSIVSYCFMPPPTHPPTHTWVIIFWAVPDGSHNHNSQPSDSIGATLCYQENNHHTARFWHPQHHQCALIPFPLNRWRHCSDFLHGETINQTLHFYRTVKLHDHPDIKYGHMDFVIKTKGK